MKKKTDMTFNDRRLGGGTLRLDLRKENDTLLLVKLWSFYNMFALLSASLMRLSYMSIPMQYSSNVSSSEYLR